MKLTTSTGITPVLSLAIDRLKSIALPTFALWVTQSPFAGGQVHRDCPWPDSLTRQWRAWQEMFSPLGDLALPMTDLDPASPPLSYVHTHPAEKVTSRVMQEFGHQLWQWVFEGSLRQTLAQSQGIAEGKNKPLRLRLEIHDPDLIALPWEIMQPEMGQQALSLDPHILFSRTTHQVAALAPQRSRESIQILLVLGVGDLPVTANNSEDEGIAHEGIAQAENAQAESTHSLALKQECTVLTQKLEQSNRSAPDPKNPFPAASVQVTTLVQPALPELIAALDSQIYNVFFYAGHGVPDANGGLLFLHPQGEGINGTELAQVLVRNQMSLSVFNTCWGAQPQSLNQSALKRSSLAEVLIHHGVPAVLAMRDAIADQEAIDFIEALAQALTKRLPIDRAVQVARQQLLTIYGFNHPAWTIPILYMHPEFDGELIAPPGLDTVLPPFSPRSSDRYPTAYLRSPETPGAVWKIYGGLMRVGRNSENDLINPEPWVSQRHAEIICREIPAKNPLKTEFSYYLRDFSRFGTLIFDQTSWKAIHHREVRLSSGIQLKFGSPEGQIYEFIVDSCLDSLENVMEQGV